MFLFTILFSARSKSVSKIDIIDQTVQFSNITSLINFLWYIFCVPYSISFFFIENRGKS